MLLGHAFLPTIYSARDGSALLGRGLQGAGQAGVSGQQALDADTEPPPRTAGQRRVGQVHTELAVQIDLDERPPLKQVEPGQG